MSEILQGTTPSLSIGIKTDYFLVSDVTDLELVIRQKNTSARYGLADVTVDTEHNAFVYDFSEAETLGLVPDQALSYQCRFKLASGKIYGTKIMTIGVADLISTEMMGT